MMRSTQSVYLLTVCMSFFKVLQITFILNCMRYFNDIRYNLGILNPLQNELFRVNAATRM